MLVLTDLVEEDFLIVLIFEDLVEEELLLVLVIVSSLVRSLSTITSRCSLS